MKRNFLLLFGICFFIYIIIDCFFSDVFLFLIGGAIGSISNEVFDTSNSILVYSIWAILLVIFIYIYKRPRKNNVVDTIFVVIIAVLLNIVDVVVYELIGSIKGEWSRYLFVVITVISKSILLFWIICSKKRWQDN